MLFSSVRESTCVSIKVFAHVHKKNPAAFCFLRMPSFLCVVFSALWRKHRICVAFWLNCPYSKGGKPRVLKSAANSYTAKHAIWIVEILACNLVVDAWNEERKTKIRDPLRSMVSSLRTILVLIKFCASRVRIFPCVCPDCVQLFSFFEFILSRLLKLNNFRWGSFWRKMKQKSSQSVLGIVVRRISC